MRSDCEGAFFWEAVPGKTSVVLRFETYMQNLDSKFLKARVIHCQSASRTLSLRGDTHSGLARVRHQVWLIRNRSRGMIFGPPGNLVRAVGHFGSQQVIRIRYSRQPEFLGGWKECPPNPRLEYCSREEGPALSRMLCSRP